MNRSQRLGLLKVVCCCLLFFGISFIQVSPAAYAADGTIVEVIDSQGAVTASLEGAKGNIYAGGAGHEGDLVLLDRQGLSSVHIDGGGSNLDLGGNGHYGDISLYSKEGKDRIVIEGYDSSAVFYNPQGEVTVKIDGKSGDIVIAGISFKSLLQRLEALEK